MSLLHIPTRATCTVLVRAAAWIAVGAIAAAQLPAGPHNPASPRTVGKLPAPQPSPAAISFCFGDGSSAACPCDNPGAPGHGCQNSAFSGGAVLWATGASRLGADEVRLDASGLLPTTLAIVLQADASTRPANFGDGLRCIGGSLKRMYAQYAISGMISVPQPGETGIAARSNALGDPIPNGGVRHYQVLYRDPAPRFCAAPTGGSFNVSNAVSLTWVK